VWTLPHRTLRHRGQSSAEVSTRRSYASQLRATSGSHHSASAFGPVASVASALPLAGASALRGNEMRRNTTYNAMLAAIPHTPARCTHGRRILRTGAAVVAARSGQSTFCAADAEWQLHVDFDRPFSSDRLQTDRNRIPPALRGMRNRNR